MEEVLQYSFCLVVRHNPDAETWQACTRRRVTYVLCLDCALSQLEDDDSVSVSVSVDLLRRLRDGIL